MFATVGADGAVTVGAVTTGVGAVTVAEVFPLEIWAFTFKV